MLYCLLDDDIVKKKEEDKNLRGKQPVRQYSLTTGLFKSERCPSAESAGMRVRWSAPELHPSSCGEAVPAPCPVLAVSGSSRPFTPGRGKEQSGL